MPSLPSRAPPSPLAAALGVVLLTWHGAYGPSAPAIQTRYQEASSNWYILLASLLSVKSYCDTHHEHGYTIPIKDFLVQRPPLSNIFSLKSNLLLKFQKQRLSVSCFCWVTLLIARGPKLYVFYPWCVHMMDVSAPTVTPPFTCLAALPLFPADTSSIVATRPLCLVHDG